MTELIVHDLVKDMPKSGIFTESCHTDEEAIAWGAKMRAEVVHVYHRKHGIATILAAVEKAGVVDASVGAKASLLP